MKPTTKPIDSSRREFLKTTAIVLSTTAFNSVTRGEEPPKTDPALPNISTLPNSKPATTGLLPRTIHPFPNNVTWGTGTLSLRGHATLAVARESDPGVVEMMKETWQQFTLGAMGLKVNRDSTLKAGEFTLAGARPPQPEPNASYTLKVDASGIAASAADAPGARHAWFTMLQLLGANDTGDGGIAFALPYVEIHDWPMLKFRGLHLCVFHETTPVMIEKAIRLAAFLKFTHVVLEFWGMLRLDTLKELAWPEAWTKAQAGNLVGIARAMGIEVIPMFNAWGHAAASRIKYGRHVALDQNPRLAPLFEPDGWTWCLTNSRAQKLLRKVCDELIEFAGPGQFFHIGCDEAYSHATCDRCRQTDRVKLFADHVNNLAADLEKRGRRPIMWGDSLLERAKWSRPLEANGTPTLPTHEALKQISQRIVIADWQYGLTNGDVPTLAHFREHGFETLACPWNSPTNIRTLAKGAVANNSAGLLMTTWHHLAQSIPKLAYVANCVWSQDQATLGLRQMDNQLIVSATASSLRKLLPAKSKFERAGWNGFELPAEPD